MRTAEEIREEIKKEKERALRAYGTPNGCPPHRADDAARSRRYIESLRAELRDIKES